MHRSYHDILSLIPQNPTFWQEGGIPRFMPFTPRDATGVYTTEAVLAKIRCQNCHESFVVLFEQKNGDLDRLGREAPSIAERITSKSLHYGDPPNVTCCAAGPSMNSELCEILEYWSRNHQEFVKEGKITDMVAYFEWRRNPDFELTFDPDTYL